MGKSMQDNDRHVIVVITPTTIMSIPTKIFHYVWMNNIEIRYHDCDIVVVAEDFLFMNLEIKRVI